MATKTLTAANSVILLAIPRLIPVPTQLQGFATDDVTDFESIDIAETQEGVDGKLSAGWVFKAVKMGVTLQADSDSNGFFENWFSAENAVREKYFANGSIYLPSVQRKYTMTKGVLMNYSPVPTAKKILQPRKFTIVWESVSPAGF